MTNSALRALSVVYTVACILTGEIGVVPEAAPAVAQVAMNRLDAGMGYEGWHAIADQPADWALEAAWQAWKMGGDANGNIHAISGADMIALGFDERNWTQVGSRRWPEYVGKDWE